MPTCPKCHSTWLMQTEDPNRFICLDCKTEYELKPVESKTASKNSEGCAVIKICLLIGEPCKYAEYKYMPRESQFQIKTCTANYPCSHQYITSEKELAEIGPCEKADFCPMASEACKLAYNMNAFLPKMRWINCLYGGSHAQMH